MLLTSFILLSTAALSYAQTRTFAFDCTNARNVCNNMCYHYRCVDTRHIVLTFDSDRTVRAQRRRDSGCVTNSRAPCRNPPWNVGGNSCDEMPYASTQEGGTGSTLRCVPGPENSSQGGQLSGFYRHLPDGTRFRISISNEQNSPLCTQVGCVNDGKEFHLSGGAYVIVPRDTDAQYEFLEGDTARELRRFVDERGVVHTLLTGDDDLVGDVVTTHNGTEYRIVSEVAKSM